MKSRSSIGEVGKGAGKSVEGKENLVDSVLFRRERNCVGGDLKQERVRCGDICSFAAKVWFSGGRERVGDCRADTRWWFECPC